MAKNKQNISSKKNNKSKKETKKTNKGKNIKKIKEEKVLDSSEESNSNEQETKKPNYDDKLLYIQTPHATVIKTLFEVIKEILPETTIEFGDKKMKNKDGETYREKYIKIFSTDKTKNVIIHVKLLGEHFSEFICNTTNDSISVGLNITELYNLIKPVDKDTVMTMYINKHELNELKINMVNESRNKISDVSLRTIDIDHDQLEPNNIDYDVQINMSTKEFHTNCKEMSNIGEQIEFKCFNDRLEFSCKNDTCTKNTITGVKKNNKNNNDVEIVISEKNISENASNKDLFLVDGIFSLKYILLFNKCHDISEKVNILLKNKFPLIIEYDIGHLGKLRFCLTPIDPKNDDTYNKDEYYGDYDYESSTDSDSSLSDSDSSEFSSDIDYSESL